MDGAGWLPYRLAVSYQLVEECDGDRALLDRRLLEFYTENWNSIETEMGLRLKDYAICEESEATFQEALAAHREGFYRCVCRVLFPEIERVLRMHFFEDKAGRISACRLLKRFTNQGDLEDFISGPGHGWILFGRLITHLYEEVSEENRKDYLSNSVPNRHAALHGLIPYSTYKHSVNMIVMTDYVFQTITDKRNNPACQPSI